MRFLRHFSPATNVVCGALLLAVCGEGLLLPQSAYETIERGGIAEIQNFLSPAEVSQLRSDAHNLYQEGNFIVDALAGYGGKAGAKDKAKFTTAKDRSVLPAYIPSQKKDGPFRSATLGNADARKKLGATIAGLRADLSRGLGRPGLDTPDGGDNHEISYTRFGPGAFLARHVDERSEELKGVAGWSRPTRRSVSWLVYLNEPDWDAVGDGGCLRTYERTTPPAFSVGARNGDLQIGVLRATPTDPLERPVFLDARRGNVAGRCALYIDSNDGGRRIYLTQEFDSHPYLFLSGDFFVQNLLIQDRDLKDRFHYLEQPKSKMSEFFAQDPGETTRDTAPLGGTLVVFDSVALPHEVLPSLSRERWATSGWFHERQQEEPSGTAIFL